MKAVLDASALLAYLWQEPGGEQIEDLLQQGHAVISAANLCEVLSRAVDKGMSAQDAHAMTRALGLDVQAFDAALAHTAAELRISTRHLGLSLGDRACLSLAKHLGLKALTTDKAWAQLAQLPSFGVTVQLLR